MLTVAEESSVHSVAEQSSQPGILEKDCFTNSYVLFPEQKTFKTYSDSMKGSTDNSNSILTSMSFTK